MGLIPTLLGAIGKPCQLAYKVTRLVCRIQDTRKPLLIVDHLASFVLDVNGKVRISLAWLVIKLVHGKIRCQQLAGKTAAWLEEKCERCIASSPNKALEKDLDACLSPSTVAGADPHVHAGILFLRDCLDRLQAGDADVRARFAAEDGSLDTRATLIAFYSTPSAYKLADALANPDATSFGARQNLLDKVYEDLRLALKRDLTEMFIM